MRADKAETREPASDEKRRRLPCGRFVFDLDMIRIGLGAADDHQRLTVTAREIGEEGGRGAREDDCRFRPMAEQCALGSQLNRPGFAGDRLVKLCGQCWRVQFGIVSFFCLGWRYVADGLQKACGC